MPFEVQVPFEKRFVCAKPLEAVFDYLANVRIHVAECFPGLEKIEQTDGDCYRWTFQKFGHSGYEFQLQLTNRFELARPNAIRAIPQPASGTCRFDGGWTLESQGDDSTEVFFQVRFALELPLPRLMRAVAAPVVQREITKLFDRYTLRVAKALES